jgi:hypothetical protein
MDPIEQARQEHLRYVERTKRWGEDASRHAQETLRIAAELAAARAVTARRIDLRERAKLAIAAASLLAAVAAVCIAILH